MELDKTNQLKTNKDDNRMQLNKMGTTPIGRLLVGMSLPAMFSMLVQALYNIVDSIFVGHISESAFTAVSLVFPIQMLVISVGVGTGIGLNSLISRRLGARSFAEANSAASHGMLLAILNWAIFAIFGFFFSGMFVRAFSDKALIVDDAIIYCQIVTIFSLFIFVQINVEKILQATGNMIFPMIANLVGAVTNIIFDPIFIFGYLGSPRMGVMGAAVATVLGQFIAMCMGLVLLFIKKHDVNVNLRTFKFQWSTIKNIYAVGIPSIIMQAIGSVMIIGLNAILIAFSGAAVAVLGAYFKLQSFIFMPVFGLTQGAMPIFGYNYGAKDKERLMKAFKLSLIMAVAIMAVGTVVFQIFPGLLLSMFNASPEMLRIGVPALRMISTCFIFAAFGIVSSTLFQATGHGTMSLWISLLRQLILILPLTFILARFIGLEFVWLSFPMAEIFSALATVLLLRVVYNRQIKNLGVQINK